MDDGGSFHTVVVVVVGWCAFVAGLAIDAGCFRKPSTAAAIGCLQADAATIEPSVSKTCSLCHPVGSRR